MKQLQLLFARKSQIMTSKTYSQLIVRYRFSLITDYTKSYTNVGSTSNQQGPSDSQIQNLKMETFVNTQKWSKLKNFGSKVRTENLYPPFW